MIILCCKDKTITGMIKKRTTKVALFKDLFVEKAANCRFRLTYQVLWR